MLPYHFQSEDFALSEDGIHLLRNKFNFKTISYDQVTNATMQKAVEIKRPMVILVAGILMLVFAVKQILWVFWMFNNPHESRIYIESIVVPVIPGLLGIYCVYSAIRKGPVLTVAADKATYKLRLRAIEKGNQLPELTKYLDAKLKLRLHISPSIS
jgi:hypothetical protein